MSYSSSSPVPYNVHMGGGHHGGNPGVPGGGPGTPIISSPQDAANGADGNYMMKNVQPGMQVNYLVTNRPVYVPLDWIQTFF